MSRPLRIEIENGLYHVTARGWERRSIVTGDRDRKDWLRLLDRVATRCGWHLFAWVLMTNHFHLTEDALRQPRRHHNQPRIVAIYLLRRLSNEPIRALAK